METKELLNERAKTHGDYRVHAEITQRLKDYVHAREKWSQMTPSQREAIDMILHKIGRIFAGNPSFKDHWADIAGYAKLVADQCPE